MFSLFFGLYEYLFRKAEFRLLLVGLDKAGKTSCLEKLRALQLAPLDSSAAVSAAAAVQLPVAPTVGLNIARFELSGCKLTLWDLGGQAGLRSIWEKYYADTHALIYVVDASSPDRFEESRAALEKALATKELDGAPLLVFANKKDAAGSNAATVVASALGKLVDDRPDRPARIVATCALNGDGLRDGLLWCMEAARKSRRTRMLAEHAAASSGR